MNNLRNVRDRDEIYEQTWKRIKRYVGIEDHVFKILAVDAYFIHYSVHPKLVENNEDPKLEEIRRFFERYMSSKDYRRLKPLTTLNDPLSMVYAINLVRSFAKHGDLFKAHGRAEEAVRYGAMLVEMLGIRGAELIDLVEETLDVEFSKDILSMAVEMMRSVPLAVRIEKEKDRFGDEIHGYSITRRIERAVPRELALPEELFTVKLVEGFITREKVRRKEGKLYVLLDVSGSMRGEKCVWSRSVALALYKMAKRKGLEFVLRPFNDALYGEYKGKEVLKVLLGLEPNGGTNINLALMSAKEGLVIIITDGLDDVSVKKRGNVTLVSVMIRGHNEALRRISDFYMKVETSLSHGAKVLRVVNVS